MEDLPRRATTVVGSRCTGTPCKTWLQGPPVAGKRGYEQKDCKKILEQAHGGKSQADAIGFFTVQLPH